MKSFDYWKVSIQSTFLACLMLISGMAMGQFVTVGDPSGVANTSTTYPSPFGNYYWGSRQQFLYPAAELAAAGLGAGPITAIQFDVIDTDLSQPHENYQISIGQTATASLAGWESGLTPVFGPVTQAPIVGLNTFTFSSAFIWDGVSNVVIEICHSNSSFTDNCHVEWTTPQAYTASYTYRADASFVGDGGCSTTLNSCAIASVNCDRRPLTDFEGTLASCPPPLDVLVDNITENSADLSWTDTGGDVYIEYGIASFTPGSDATAGGGTVLGPFTGGSYTLGGLSPQTDYEVYFREECTPGTWSLNSSETFSTSCSIFTAPFFEDFEGLTTSNTEDFPNCWETLGAKPWFVRNSAFTGTPNPYGDLSSLELTDHTTGSGSYIWTDGSSPNFSPDDGSAANNEVITPPIDISALTTPYVSFWVGSYYTGTSGDNELKLYAWDGAAWELLTTYNDNTQNSWVEVNAVVPGTIPSVTQFRLVVWSVSGSSFYNDILVDDFSVAEAPTCLSPDGVFVDGLTSGSADVSWTCTGCTGQYYVEYGAPGFTPGADENAGTGTVIGPFAGLSTTIPGLSPSTDYEFVVRQDCGSEFSTNTPAQLFTTSCVALSAPWTEDFETFASSGSTVPVCWENTGPDFWNINEVAGYDLGTSIGGSDHTTGTGNWLLADGSDGYPVDDGLNAPSIALITPPIDISGLSVPYFSMWVGKYNNSTTGQNDLKAYAWDGSSWVEFISYSDVSNPSWTEVGNALPGGLPGVTQIRLVVWNIAANAFNDDVMIDDLSLGEAPSCLAPGNPSVDAVTSGSADVSWTCTGCTGQYYVEYGAPGFTPGVDENAGTGTVIGPFAGLSATIPGLSADTDYAFVVRQDCGLDGFSSNSGQASFFTGYCTDGGPSSSFDSNMGIVETSGFAGSSLFYDHCASPGGPDAGFIGVNDQTALSFDVVEGFPAEITVEVAACDGSTFGGAHSVWIDWNDNLLFEAGEVVGSGTGNPVTNTYDIIVPPGTSIGPKRMRVTQQEGGSLPLDPCASFTWGSVTDFTVEVVPSPGCLPTDADLTLDVSSCVTPEFFINIDILSVGDSPGGEVTISNTFDGNTITNATVAGSPYVYGPFPSGTDLDVTIEHLGNALCSYTTGFSYTCPPPNDDCADVTPVTLISGVSETFNGTTVGATSTGDEAFAANPTVWHAIELTGVCNNVVVDYCGTAAGVMGNAWINLATACPATTFTPAGTFDTETCGDGNVTIYHSGLAAGIYYIPVMGFSDGLNDPGPYTLNVLSEDCPPPPTDFCDAQFSNSPGSFISDGAPVNDVLTVGPQVGGSVITDLDVVIDINHTWTSDLTIELLSPCGTSIILQDAQCGSADDQEAYYDDDASFGFAGWCASRIGPVIPEEALSAFNNEIIEGDWTLTVTDNAGGDDGTLVQWCLVPTLGNVCLTPQVIVTDYTNSSITVDIVADGCFDAGNYDTFDLTWTGGGSVNGVTFPYEITGLDPATLYIVDIIANCTIGGSSGQTAVSQTTTNCDPIDECTYELTLTNTSGDGWDGAFARVDNGWSSTDYVMQSDVSSQTWEIIACPGQAISLEVVNGGNGTLPGNLTISFVNSDGVEVFFDSGPPETVLYNQANGCPDCASVTDIEFTRLAADLVELNWSNIELPANVSDIQVLVLIPDFFDPIEIGNATFPAGTTSGSVVLDGSYPFENVIVQVITNCTNEGGAVAEEGATLPGCDAVDQCEYAFDMTSNDNGWVNYSLDALLDGLVSVGVALESGTSGTQTVYACAGGTIDVSTLTGGSVGVPDDFCINTTQYPGATQVVSTTGTVTTITTCNFGGEYSSLNLGLAGQYEFTSSIASDYFTFTDASNNVIAAGQTPLEAAIPAGGTYRLHINTDINCGTDFTCRATTAQRIGGGAAGCDSFSFSLTLNPSTDNVELISETDFCPFDDGELIFSGSTCPSCFAPTNVTLSAVVDSNADFEWFSNNPAGTDYTVYVGLPGFTPGVDEVSSTSGTTVATGAQGPVNVSGLTAQTDYEVIVIEDCSGDPSDQSPAVPFTTTLANDDCAAVTPVTLMVMPTPNSIFFTGSSVGALDNSVNESYGVGQAWEAFELVGCAQTVTISFCGSIPVMNTAFTGISTGCPAEFPDNYLQDDWNWADCVDGNPSLIYADLPEGTYYIPIIEGHDYEIEVEALGCEGCTDPNAINYDPDAVVDDGSCLIPTCDWPTVTINTTADCLTGTYTIEVDIANDGDSPDYDVYVNSAASPPFCDEAQGSPGFPSDPTCEASVCAGDSFCCNNTWDGICAGSAATDPACTNCLSTAGSLDFIGTFAGGTTGIDAGSYQIGSEVNVIVEHNVDPNCDQTFPVSSDVTCGCTNMAAINYNPSADQDDGSCIVPDCVDPPTQFTYCYGNNEDSSFEFAPITPGDNIIIEITQGSVESSTFDDFIVYDGSDDSAPILYSNPAATTNLDGLVIQSTLGNGLFITITSDISVSCGSGSFLPIIFDLYCGFQAIPGCTDINAVNYDPLANVDDGSCVFAPTNDDCADAQTLNPVQYPSTQNALGTLSGASQNGSSACVGTNGPDVFYTFNVPLENHYWVNLNPFGGFSGVVEVLDACDGTVVACELAPPSAPFCDVAQGTPGFPSDPGCQASVCAGDSFCCNTSWDGICAGNAATDPNCTDCLSTAPAGSGPISIFIQNLPAGDYIVRVRDYYGAAYLDNSGQFLVNVQYFPFAGVQDNPNSFLYACNQTGFQLEDFVGATPQSGQGALDYQWYIYEEGGTFSNLWQRGEPNYVSRCFWLEMDYGFTYNVFVRILLNVPGEGPVWGVFPYLDTDPHAVGASACTITTATNVTPTELRPNYTPTNANGDLYSLCDFAIAYNVAESENFRWRFDPDTDPNNGNEIFYTRGVGNPSVRLSWVNGLLPGAIYNVAVEVMVDGQWSGFSTVLPIELALPPNNVVIRPQFCGGIYSPSDYILSESVCEADLYQFRFTPTGGGAPSYRNSGNYVCWMSAANPSLTPGDYDVQVKVTQNGVPGDWGPVCTITIAGPQGQGNGEDTPILRDIESTNAATLFPNPNAGNEVRVELSGLGEGNHEVNVNIYDVYGKLISTDGFGHEGTEMSRLIRFDENLATGMYMVHVFVDGEQFTVERLVVK